MRLSEHPDFRQAIVQAADHFADRGLRPALIEKDYYVTETLRLIASTVGDKIIFKGGTSLSKGWNLIQRCSEDVDIFLDPRAFNPVLAKNGIPRQTPALLVQGVQCLPLGVDADVRVMPSSIQGISISRMPSRSRSLGSTCAALCSPTSRLLASFGPFRLRLNGSGGSHRSLPPISTASM